MLKLGKKITVAFLVGAIISTTTVSSYAIDKSNLITTECYTSKAELQDKITDKKFDKYIENLGDCEVRLSVLNDLNVNHVYDDEIHSIERQINEIEKNIDNCGIMTLDDPELVDIILGAEYRDKGSPLKISGPKKVSDPSGNLVSQLKQLYNVYASACYRNIDGESHKIVEVVVKDASKPNSVHLQKLNSKWIYGPQMWGKNDGSNFTKDVLTVAYQFGINHFVSYLKHNDIIPYQYLLESTMLALVPPEQISAYGNSVELKLHTVETVKFTYIQKTNGDWVQTLSSNCINGSNIVTMHMSINGVPYDPTPKVESFHIDGGYGSSVDTAVTMYRAMQSSPNVSSGNVGVRTVAFNSSYKGALINYMICPGSPLGL